MIKFFTVVDLVFFKLILFMHMFHIYLGEDSSSLEKTAANDLVDDLELITTKKANIHQINEEFLSEEEDLQFPDDGDLIIVGTPDSNPLIKHFIIKKEISLTKENPGPRGRLIHLAKDVRLKNRELFLILGGSDAQGTQYSIYDFCSEYLGVDPFRFWTCIEPTKDENFNISKVNSEMIDPPLVPILAYFDNDNDELANITKPYLEFGFKHWKEIINTLVRLRYNVIDIHDHLGRAEFYRWPHYQKIRPDYEPNTELLNKIIDYAHERGVMIQVSFYLGWKFKVISDKASVNWEKYKKEWLEVWKYYLTETPIGKCDIFLNRPRDQRWDRRYKGKGDPVDVFNEAFPEMARIIKSHNPDAKIVVDLYSEGRGVYKRGFRPKPKEDFIMVWPDDGFGKFEYMPDDLGGYDWGIYMHAGFFLNHVVQDPYPNYLEEAMKPAFQEYNMNKYCLVNGQTFRHFIINLEACSLICQNPHQFDSEAFLQQWAKRYFGKTYQDKVVDILKLLNRAQEDRMGYINIMSHLKYSAIRIALRKYLFFIPITWINKIYEKIGNLGETYTRLTSRNLDLLEKALSISEDIKEEIQNNDFFYDHIILQVKLLYHINKIAYNLQMAGSEKNYRGHIQKASRIIKKHHKLRLGGDRCEKWDGWYDPNLRRPNGGYFDMKKLKKKNKIKIHKNR